MKIRFQTHGRAEVFVTSLVIEPSTLASSSKELPPCSIPPPVKSEVGAPGLRKLCIVMLMSFGKEGRTISAE